VTPYCGPPSGLSATNIRAHAQYSDETIVAGYRRRPYAHFETNFQRFQAEEMQKLTTPQNFSKRGFIGQLAAAGSHHKTDTQLDAMAEAVGRERIAILHGTDDKMIQVANGERLIIAVRPGIAHIVPGMGHAPPTERTAWFNAWLQKRFENGEIMDGRA
jgi:glycylpeptide N-tetradecanoyltransferase